MICARSTLYLHHYTISSNPLSSLRVKYPTLKLANLVIYDFPLDLELHITSSKLTTSASTPVSLWHIHCNVLSFICLSEKNKKNYNSVISQPCQLGRTLPHSCAAVPKLCSHYRHISRIRQQLCIVQGAKWITLMLFPRLVYLTTRGTDCPNTSTNESWQRN